MERDFKEPRLDVIYIKSPEDLRKTLVERRYVNLYKKYIDKGILEYNKQDLEEMCTMNQRTLFELEEEKERDLENESFILDIEKKKCELYAQSFDMEEFEKLASEITMKECSNALKMDILMCKIRMAIILEDRKYLVRTVEDAIFVSENSSDWDRKNRFKVYLGLVHLIKAEFEEAARHFSDALASFDAKELLSFETVILYLVFSSLIAFDRNDLKSKVIDNPEVRKCASFLKLPESLFNCEYHQLFMDLLNFIDFCEKDPFLDLFKEYFCKEMKIKSYGQLLNCYQSLHLERMAECFNVEQDHVEEDLRNFIVEKRLNCIIDRVDMVVRMKKDENENELQKLIKNGEYILRNIKKTVRK